MDESAAQYEFTSDQNTKIVALAKKMGLVGWAQIVFGALVFVGTLFTITEQGTSGLITGGIIVLVGRWTLTAGRAFQRMVDTSGSDITNLMDALAELDKLYGLQYWAFLIGLGVVLFVMVLSLVFAVLGALG